MDNVIRVGMADLAATRHPGMLTTLGLGSCVGVAIYEPVSGIIGLAHVMLPYSYQSRNNNNIAKFADTAIEQLVIDMQKLGARKSGLIAKLAGGAQMFSFNQSSDMMKIGLRNSVASREKLSQLDIPIVAEDVGGSYGRTIELYSDGRLLIKTIGHGVKTI